MVTHTNIKNQYDRKGTLFIIIFGFLMWKKYLPFLHPEPQWKLSIISVSLTVQYIHCQSNFCKVPNPFLTVCC